MRGETVDAFRDFLSGDLREFINGLAAHQVRQRTHRGGDRSATQDFHLGVRDRGIFEFKIERYFIAAGGVRSAPLGVCVFEGADVVRIRNVGEHGFVIVIIVFWSQSFFSCFC